MLNPERHAAIMRWLYDNSRSPARAMLLYNHILTVVHPATGEVKASRGELAFRLGFAPRDVTRMMSELKALRVIRKEWFEGKDRWYFNSQVATHMQGDQRRTQQEFDGQPCQPALPFDDAPLIEDVAA